MQKVRQTVSAFFFISRLALLMPASHEQNTLFAIWTAALPNSIIRCTISSHRLSPDS